MHTTDLAVLTTQQIGTEQHLTPEGYLLCMNVPIGRTGVMQYSPAELAGAGMTPDSKTGIIYVERSEADLFRDETIRSFMGKPVVNEHPDDVLTPLNTKQHQVGVTLHPRRGEGEQAMCMLADLLITDDSTITAVRAGKREVSSGYDAEYEQIAPGKARQRDIIGNHVALVMRGRCGSTCAIGDGEMKKKSFKDRVMDLMTSHKDMKSFKDALEDMEEGDKEEPTKDEEAPAGGGATHVHVHLGPAPDGSQSTAPAKDDKLDEGTEGSKGAVKDEEEVDPANGGGGDVEARLTALEQGVAGIIEAVQKLAAAENTETEETITGDGAKEDPDAKEDEEGEKKAPPFAKDRKMVGDSAGLATEFQDAISVAEIIIPGFKMPTFDAKAKMQATKDSLCAMKRTVLDRASLTPTGMQAIKRVTMKDSFSSKGMPCDAVSVLFQAVGGTIAEQNRRGKTADGGMKSAADRAKELKLDKGLPKPQSPADFNKQMRKHYGQDA